MTHRWRWRANEGVYFCTFCKQRCHRQGVGVWDEPCPVGPSQLEDGA